MNDFQAGFVLCLLFVMMFVFGYIAAGGTH